MALNNIICAQKCKDIYDQCTETDEYIFSMYEFPFTKLQVGVALLAVTILLVIWFGVFYADSTPKSTTMVRADGRCGPSYGDAKCAPTQCCATAGWCAPPNTFNCMKGRNLSTYNGDGAVITG